VADTFSVTGPAMNQLPLPVEVDGAAGGSPLRCGGALGELLADTTGGVLSVACP
jgi:hypothetical protein